jgi:hypothetical protein
VDSIGWNFCLTRRNGSTTTKCKKFHVVSVLRKSPLNLRLVFNSLLDLQEVGCGGMDWTDLAEDRVAGTCKCGNELDEHGFGSQEGLLHGVSK